MVSHTSAGRPRWLLAGMLIMNELWLVVEFSGLMKGETLKTVGVIWKPHVDEVIAHSAPLVDRLGTNLGRSG